MANESKRQSVLLGVLGMAVLAAVVRFGGLLPDSEAGMDPGNLPNIDAEGISRSLKGVNTVDAALASFKKADSDPDRDLFQYGSHRPPPPTPEEVERNRLAAEEALKRQEELARAEKKREAEQKVNPATPQDPVAQQQTPQEAQQQAAVVPQVAAGPVRQPPPTINFRFLGVMGPPEKKVAVFMEGDNMVLARKGEVIQGKFKVLDIAVEWAELGYTDPQYKDFKKRLNFGM